MDALTSLDYNKNANQLPQLINNEGMRAILDHIPSMIAWIDKDLKYIYCNKTFTNYVGLEIDEIINRTVEEVCLITYLQLKPQIDQVLQGHILKFQEELTIKGKIFFADIHFIPYFDENKNVTSYYSIINDITQHKETENQLKNSQDKFISIFRNSPVGIALFDPKGKILLANNTIQQILGYSEEELLDIDFSTIIHPEDLSSELFSKLMAGQIERYSKEQRYFHKKGHIIWTTFTMTATKDANGQISYIIGTAEDITNKKATQQLLKDSEKKLYLGQELGKFGSWFYDLKSDQVSWSKNTYKLLRASEDHPLNFAGFINLVHKNDVPLLMQKWQEALQGIPYKLEHRVDSQGIISWVTCTAKVVFDEKGQPSYAVGAIRDITERKEAESQLSESQKRFQSVFARSPIGITLVDQNNKMVMVNQSLQDLLGYSEEELFHLTFPEFTHPDDVNKNLNLFNDLHAGKIEKYSMEKRYIHKKGHIVWGHLTVSAEYDSNGQVIYSIAMVEDITKKKQTEALLKESEEKLALGQVLGKFGSWYYNIKTDDITWSKNTYQLFRLPENTQLDFGKFIELIHPEDRQLLMNKWQEALQGKPYKIEHRINSQGVTSWFNGTAKIVFDDDGQPSYAIGAVIDITERKKAENELIESQQKFKSIFSRSPIGIALVGSTGKVLMANHSLKEFLGYSEKELAQLTFPEFTHPEDIEKDVALYQQLYNGEIEKYSIEKRYINKKGHIIWGNLTVTVEHDIEGKVKYAIGMVEDISEKKKTEALLKESEEKLALGQSIGKLGSWYYNIKADQITWSKNTYQLFRISKDTHLNFATYLNLIHPEDREILLHRWQEALKGKPYYVEHRLEQQGITSWLSGTAKIIFDENGEPSYAIGAVLDITERKENEQKLIDSKKRLDLAQRVAKVGSWYIDAHSNQINWSPETYRIFGVEEGTLIDYDKFISYVHDEDKEQLNLHWQKALEGDPYQIEHRIVVHGQIKWVLETADINYDKENSAISAIGAVQDITEKKEREEKLRTSEERYNLAMQGMDAGVWDWDVKTGETIFSERWAEIIGYTIDELQPLSFDTWVNHTHPKDVEKAQRALDSYFEGLAENYEVEVRMKHKAGHWVWVLAKGSVSAWTSEGQPLRMTGTHLDISERKQAEIELKNYRDNLKELVKEQTQELKAINKDLEAFAYSISHDLRAPLRYIDGFSHLLKRTIKEPTGQQTRFLGNISEGIRNMSMMIDALLEFSRLGRKELSKSTLDTNKIISQTIKELLAATQNRKIKWIIGNLPSVEGDYALIKMVFENLISNAIKFSRDRSTSVIEINVKEPSDISGKTTIYVKDNGVGFDMEYANKLFGVFQRLHNQEEFEGTGIGLANIKRIINKHGGIIRAEAEEDKGACFYITI